ncbi:MAG: GNAT family N-acetyltransferase [Ignavibacteria bacterium]|nr:GNAT family N-acetyltransferase [Ignavibacteria bacterium]
MGTITPFEKISKDKKKILIRTAQVKDASKIVKLMRDVIKEGPYTLAEPDEYNTTAADEAAKIRRCRDKHGKIYLVAEYKDEIAGFICLDSWPTRRTWHTGLFSVYLKKKWRSKGVGSMLIKAMLDWGKTDPVNRKISLAVFSTNKDAIAFYRKLGFKNEGCCKRDMIIDGEYVDSVLMYKYTK